MDARTEDDDRAPDGIGQMMTIREAATVLNVHVSTLRRWEKAGWLEPVRLGPRGHRRYARHQILGLAHGGDNDRQAHGQVRREAT